MSRKICAVFILIVLVVNVVPTISSNAEDIVVDRILSKNNTYLEYLDIANYFGYKNIASKPLNTSLVQTGLISSQYPAFVYGSDDAASEESIKNSGGAKIKGSEYRCLGYTKDDSLYANPEFPADYPFDDGTIIESKVFYEKPWKRLEESNLIKRFLKDKEFIFDSDNLPEGKKDFFRESIIYGMALEYGKFYKGDEMFSKTDTELRASVEELRELMARPNPADRKIGFLNGSFTEKDWENYVHIIQPPTDNAWGFGILFHRSGGSDFYFTVPLVPMELLEDDIIATFESVKCIAGEGKKIQVAVNVKSKFDVDITPNFSWEIVQSNNNTKVPVVYEGHSNIEAGPLTIPRNGERVLYANFTMPKSAVKIRFKVNENGDNPEEKSTKNNFLSWEVKLNDNLDDKREYNLPYNVLSTDVKYSYLDGKEVVAQLSLERGNWSGNATGALDLFTDPSDLFRNLVLRNLDIKNPNNSELRVDEAAERVVKTPVINTTFKREDFDDDPIRRAWRNLSNPSKPETRTGKIFSNSNPNSIDSDVQRPYQYKCDSEECLETHTGTAYADFNPSVDTSVVNTYIYNGREIMPDVSSRHFKKVVENNTLQSKFRNLFWISDPYNLDVIRMMHRVGADERKYDWQKIDGQHDRTFTQQNTANITWKATSPMSEIYKKERETARAGVSGAQYYPNVVFATDIDLQQAKYPFKSGYYFNPKGVYTCTIETTQYKNTPDFTKEHKELVEKLTNAFHFTSNILYTVDGKVYQRLDLTNKNRGALGMNLLTVQSNPTNKKTERLMHALDDSYSLDQLGSLDEQGRLDSDYRFKEILEGYSNSNTLDSKQKYLYREYIKEGDIYKVHETTIVTFSISPPPGQKLYTYLRMSNGNYNINVSVDEISLDNYRYDGLTIKKVNSVDGIPVTVYGTMYDDLNNGES